MIEMNTEIAETQAELLLNEVKQVSFELSVIDEKVGDFADRQLYYGKTVEQWSSWFSLSLNMNATPLDVKSYAVQLSERMDMAYRNKGRTSRKYSEFKAKYELDKSNIIERHASNKSRKTMPAADTLEKVATSEMGIQASLCLQYENALNFWQDVIYKLHSVLKLVNILAMSNGTMAKIEGNY